MDTTNTYKVPVENLPSLQAALAKLSAKVAKLAKKGLTGTNDIGVMVLDTVKEEKITETGGKRVRLYHIVQVTGVAPIIAGGWEFVATLQHEAGGNIVRAVPTAKLGEKELAAYRTVDPFCEHCKTQRRRIDTFVVRSAVGVTKQVGRNCLRDFTGHDSPELLAKYAELLAASSEILDAAGSDGYGGGRSETYIPMDEYLPVVAAIVRTWGWVSRGKARNEGGMATADIAWAFFNETNSERRKNLNLDKIEVTEGDKAFAKAALAHAEEKFFE